MNERVKIRCGGGGVKGLLLSLRRSLIPQRASEGCKVREDHRFIVEKQQTVVADSSVRFKCELFSITKGRSHTRGPICAMAGWLSSRLKAAEQLLQQVGSHSHRRSLSSCNSGLYLRGLHPRILN